MRTKRSRVLVAAVLGAITTIGLAACSSSSSSNSSPAGGSTGSGAATSTASTKPLSLRVAYSQAFAGSASVLIAQDEGFFTKNNLNVKLVALSGSSTEAAALEAKSVDLISVTVEEPLALASASGTQLQAVMGQNKQFFSLVASTSIPNNGTYPDNVKALKGKTIGVSALNSSPYYLLLGILKSAGLTAKDVRIVAVGKGPTRLAALEGNRVNAVMMSSDSAAATATGKAYVMVDLSQPGVGPSELANAIYGGVWATKSFVSGNTDAINRFRKAMAQAMVWSADPANTAAYTKEVGKAAGASVPAADLAAAAKLNLENGNSGYYSAADLTGYYNFLLANAAVKPIPNFSGADFIAPGTPTTQAEVEALAGS